MSAPSTSPAAGSAATKSTSTQPNMATASSMHAAPAAAAGGALLGATDTHSHASARGNLVTDPSSSTTTSAAAPAPSSLQLSSAVLTASDRLAQLSAALSPSWPAESVALGGVSGLPAQVATAAVDPAASAALARQLVRGGYALAGLVVAVMAWQLAASVPGAHLAACGVGWRFGTFMGCSSHHTTRVCMSLFEAHVPLPMECMFDKLASFPPHPPAHTHSPAITPTTFSCCLTTSPLAP